MKQNSKTIITVVVVVIVVIGAFFGGVSYGKSHATFARMGQFGTVGRTGNNRLGMLGGAAAGEVLSMDATSITIKLQSGGSRIVLFTPNTPVMKAIAGTSADIQVGSQISVIGASNSDGSVTAQSIQIRPAGMMRGASSTVGY